ncbi:MAG TPA: 3'(2'),5'-bisphosphate nucleotidase CysQ [Legionella sp.]|nr:3'(2'),5'-bisphosphate nucleotidase CysQ [Legionella sp.]
MILKHEFELELALAIAAVQEACLVVMDHYDSDRVEYTNKMASKSPVTQADLDANRMICNRLEKSFNYPVLSEENKDNLSRLSANTIWILDPLDGTKEYIAKNGEFSINLALVENGYPVLGVIAHPIKNRIYYASKNQGAFIRCNKKNTRIHVRNNTTLNNLTVAVSRSHMDACVTSAIDRMDNCQQISMGSALKYCAVAEGGIDATIRKTPLHEWDIAAADCIVREAGGVITHFSGASLLYNKEKTLIDEGIIVSNPCLHTQLLSLFL